MAYQPYVGAGRVNKELWFSRGFSNCVTLTRSQRRANKRLTFASFLTEMVKVKSTDFFSAGNMFLNPIVTNLGPSRIISAEMKSPIMLIVRFISRRFQFKTFLNLFVP